MLYDKYMDPTKKIAKILRVDKDTVMKVEEVMFELSGHDNVFDRIIEENEKITKERMELLGITTEKISKFYPHEKPLGMWVYGALLNKIKKDDKNLAEVLNYPVCESFEGCSPLLQAAQSVARPKKGLFLKVESAKELFKNAPPQNVIKNLGYKDVNELLENEDIFEIFSALRFMEEGEWLNDIFFRQYKDLTPNDFEEREIKTIVLSDKWKEVAEKFLKKKWHNISHLKEMGVIFVLPAVLKISGETLRTLALILHYYHEIDFYSKLFRKFAKGDKFAQRLIASLKGDVMDSRFLEKDLGRKWMIVQRYLAKDDENDWRLFEPHVNPEALHWHKAESDIASLSALGEAVGVDFNFWKGLGCIGDFYPTESGIDVLVSFNLVDTVMSLVKQKEMIKYLYHHQEALWNKIFLEFVGEEKMEEMIIDNFEKGYIEL